jgi:hypothetical protein
LSLSLQSWRWCLRSSSIVSSKEKKTKTTKKKPTKCPKFKCNTVSVSFLACRCNSIVLSSKVGREKKQESGDSSENGICGCGLPVCCCQPAVAGGVIYADLGGELSTHLALQALFIQSSPVCEPLLQAFPFPSTWGEVTLPQLSQACVFIYSSCGRWVFPPLLWSFPPTTTFTSFPAPDCWVCATAPAFSSWIVVRDSPPPLFRAQGALPSLLRVFFVVIVYYSVSLFFPGQGSVCPGGFADLARVVCGSTVYCLAHLVVRVIPNCLGAGIWRWPRGPPSFSI